MLGIIIFLSLHIETVDKSVFIGQNWELELGLLLALGGSTGSQLSLYFVMQLTAMHSVVVASSQLLCTSGLYEGKMQKTSHWSVRCSHTNLSQLA